MLVLSRRPEQWIGIEISREEAEAILKECGKIRIDVMLVLLQRDKARIGFAADRRIRIYRHEILEEIRLKLERKGQPEPVLKGGLEP